jgi:hypothetical protein
MRNLNDSLVHKMETLICQLTPPHVVSLLSSFVSNNHYNSVLIFVLMSCCRSITVIHKNLKRKKVFRYFGNVF